MIYTSSGAEYSWEMEDVLSPNVECVLKSYYNQVADVAIPVYEGLHLL